MTEDPNTDWRDPTSEEFIDFVEGRLDESRRRVVEAALVRSEPSAEVVRWLERFVTTSAGSIIERPSAAVHHRLLALSALLPERPPSPVECVLAVLRFDSWIARDLGPALRHVAVGDPHRQLLFSGGDVDVALDVYPETASSEVIGQVLTDHPGVPTAALAELDETDAWRELDVTSTGVFTFEWPRHRQLALRITIGDLRLNIGPFAPDSHD